MIVLAGRTEPSRGTARRRLFAAGALAVAVMVGATGSPAAAVNAHHGNGVVSDDPVGFTPHVNNGAVKSITQIGNKIIAVGTFTSVSQLGNGSNPMTRNRIFAFDATTGAIDAGFNPNLDGAANSVDSDGSHIYVAGSFNNVGGVKAKKVAKLDPQGRLVTVGGASVFPAPNGKINEVVVRGDRVYVGGFFTTMFVGGAGQPRGKLAAMDKDTGALLADVDVPFEGVYDPAIGGTTGIKRLDVSPDGSKLVAIGNFSLVGGQPRSQIAMLDLPTSGAAAVSDWATNRFDEARNNCASVFDTFMRDLDFSPDGSYFAVTTTGAFAGGAASGTMCDTASRWETAAAGAPGAVQQPTWVDYDGGDTLYGVAVTGAVVYVGGHQRWFNNPFQGDQAGPGAVSREGLAALDAVNGLPLSWNPGRARGVGAEALFATPQGLWVGSDTERISGELHKRIALMPMSGRNATTIPTVAPAQLPNELFLAERTSCTQGGVLYRVNAGGPVLAEPDASDDWSTDDGFRNTGNAASYGAAAATDATVPACTTPNIFATERWDGGSAGDGNELRFTFPVAAGKSVKVRLYFANRCTCTQSVGQRIFDVSVNGQLVLNDFDIVAAVGHDRGTMRQFTATSTNGAVTVDFGHVVENPLINGIEIIDDAGDGPTASAGTLLKRAVDGSGGSSGDSSASNATLDWSTVRGTYMINGRLFHGLADGALYTRTFDPATGTLGTAQAVNLYDDPDTGQRIPFAIGAVSGSFFDPASNRLYYTVSGDSRLYYRYFTPQSSIVGAQTFNVGSVAGFDRVSGMALAGGKLLYGSTADGALRAAPFVHGSVGAATTTDTDGSWRHREIFVP